MFSFLKRKNVSPLILTLLLFTLSLCSLASTPADKTISMDLENMNIQEAIRLFAKFNQMNVVINPMVHGYVSLHLQHVSAAKALDVLLASQALGKWRVDNTWFISPTADIVQREQETIKLHLLLQESSPLVTRVWRIQYAKAEDMARFLQDNTNSLLSKRGHLRIDRRTNSICVQDTEEQVLVIDGLIKRLDIPVQQILIEAHLASVDSDYERVLGVDFSVQPAGMNNNESPQASADPARYGLAVVKLANDTLLNVQLAALENEGHGELISSPSLFTANQQTAYIESGEEIPYQEISKSGATGVAFKKAVLSLKVTPQIMPGNQVLLQLQVNQDKPSSRMVLGVPAISTREMSTSILVRNGQTVVLGGIYEANQENEQQRLPFLGKIPLIGGLFSKQNTAETKRELLIFVTPKIIR